MGFGEGRPDGGNLAVEVTRSDTTPLWGFGMAAGGAIREVVWWDGGKVRG